MRKIDYPLDWEHNISLDKLRQDIDALEKLGATHVSIEVAQFYDCPHLEIQAMATENQKTK
jgi:hypothetical protein